MPRRSWRCRSDPTDIGPTRGSTAKVLNMFKVSAVPPRSAILTVFRGATAINDGTTAIVAVQLRLCRTSTAVVPGVLDRAERHTPFSRRLYVDQPSFV